MGMQYDVKSQHAGGSGVLIGYRARLKGAVVFPFSNATGYTTFVDNAYLVGTYARATTVATITSANHNLHTGQWVYLDWDLADNPYQVTVINANTFTVAVPDTGATSGNVDIWNDVLLQVDASNQTAYTVVIPGEGILSQNGIRVFIAVNTHATIFYG